MITVLDVETVFQKTSDGRTDTSPYNPLNYLVSVGFGRIDCDCVADIEYHFFHHAELGGKDVAVSRQRVQDVLNQTELLVAHHAKFETTWLAEAGFKYDGPVWCTMIAEYILARATRVPLSLEECAIGRKVTPKKRELVTGYLKAGIGFNRMPMSVVEEYGRGDVQTCGELYLAQREAYAKSFNAGLMKTVDLTNEFLLVLTDMERAGIAINKNELDKVEREYLEEKERLTQIVEETRDQVMGDTPINLGSVEQLSTLIYSRRVKDKKAWAEVFNIGTNDHGKPKRRPHMRPGEFASHIRDLTVRVKKTRAEQCGECCGNRFIHKIRKDGTLFAKATKCPTCAGVGYLLHDLPVYAGLKQSPRTPDDVKAGGFATDSETLEALEAKARLSDNLEAAVFLKSMVRLNAVSSYLTTFVEGIKRGTRADNVLHPTFNQCVTRTGRLSSSDPNFQNQPRGKTFPIRRVVVSRWSGGSILEGDYRQLEFRIAAELSKCPDALRDILANVDAHKFTADTITAAGQPTDRQEAKPHTFKPWEYTGALCSNTEMIIR